VPRIEAMGAEFFSSPIRVSLNLETAEAPELVKTSAPAVRAARAVTPRSPHAERSSLIPEFSFDGFVGRKANQLARAAALQVAEHPAHRTTRCSLRRCRLGKDPSDSRGRHLFLRSIPARACATFTPHSTSPTSSELTKQKSFDEFKRYYHSLDLF